MIPGGIYVVAAVGIAFAGLGIYAKVQSHRADAAISEIAAYKAQAEAESAKLRAKAAEVSERVVIEYRDRVKTIRVPTPVEVVREIQVIRDSGCTLPGEFRSLHDSAAAPSPSGQAPAGTDVPAAVPCDVAVEIIRENYARHHENAAQLEALQEWVKGVSE